MELKHDNHTKHSGSLLPSRVQKQIKNHHTPHRTSLGIASFGGAFACISSTGNMHEGLERFEAFKEETRRIERAYWASVRRAEADSKALRESYTPVFQCPVCGLFRPDGHSQKCKDLKPLDISKEEKIQRMDDPFNENTWDDKAIIDD
jgi:hypothetical protein